MCVCACVYEESVRDKSGSSSSSSSSLVSQFWNLRNGRCHVSSLMDGSELAHELAPFRVHDEFRLANVSVDAVDVNRDALEDSLTDKAIAIVVNLEERYVVRTPCGRRAREFPKRRVEDAALVRERHVQTMCHILHAVRAIDGWHTHAAEGDIVARW